MLSTERLKRLRKEYDYKQSDVADKIGVGRTTYAKYETGDIQPPIDQVIKLSDLFNVSVDYLLNKSTTPLPQKDFVVTPEVALMVLAEKSALSEEDIKYLKKTIKLLELQNKSRILNDEVGEELMLKYN